MKRDQIRAALRDQLDNGDLGPGVRAATELLLWHDGWIRRGDFHRLAVRSNDDGEVWIAWRHARDAFDADQFGPASTSEMTVLEIAIDLATGRYRFSNLGNAHAAAVLQAFTTALPQATRSSR